MVLAMPCILVCFHKQQHQSHKKKRLAKLHSQFWVLRHSCYCKDFFVFKMIMCVAELEHQLEPMWQFLWTNKSHDFFVCFHRIHPREFHLHNTTAPHLKRNLSMKVFSPSARFYFPLNKWLACHCCIVLKSWVMGRNVRWYILEQATWLWHCWVLRLLYKGTSILCRGETDWNGFSSVKSFYWCCKFQALHFPRNVPFRPPLCTCVFKGCLIADFWIWSFVRNALLPTLWCGFLPWSQTE